MKKWLLAFFVGPTRVKVAMPIDRLPNFVLRR